MRFTDYRITLDFHGSSYIVLKAKQGDTGRRIRITLAEHGMSYDIEDGCKAVFTAEKADANKLYHDCEIIGNEIIYTFKDQTVSAIGRMKCEIKLYDADEVLLTSQYFEIMVEKPVFHAGDIAESVSEYPGIEEILIKATNDYLEENPPEKGDKGDKGEKGDKGDPGKGAQLLSTAIRYQSGASGTQIPTGQWHESIPQTAQGDYLWTQITHTFDSGEPAAAYTVSRMGKDSPVITVAGVSPDERGDIPLTPEGLGALSMTLLWENASPASVFPATFVTLALSSYDGVLVFFKHAQENALASELGIVGRSGVVSRAGYVAYEGNYYIATYRSFVVNTGGVQFGAGMGSKHNADATSQNWALVPVLIYGVKGVS